MIEPLETRRLLEGTTFQNGILTIIGTDAADDVSLVQQKEPDIAVNGAVQYVNHLIVRLNGLPQGDFSYAQIKKVVVKLMGGNDELIVGKKLLPFDIDGGDGDDTLSGGRAGDILRGGAGSNVMMGNGGNDHLISVSGGDVMLGGAANDTADFSAFQTGLNITVDGVANDAAPGRTGNVEKDIETIIGGGGPDLISCAGLGYSVSLEGNGGNDTLIGGGHGDTIRGGPGNDILRGQDGNDYLNGDGGRDQLFGENDADTLNGGGKDPPLLPIPPTQFGDQDTTGGGSDGFVDTLNGGSGLDTVIFDPFDIPRNI